MTGTKKILKASWRVLREEGLLTLAEYSLKKISRGEFRILEPKTPRELQLHNPKIREEIRSRNEKILQDGAPDKFPIPPVNLVELVTGSIDLEWFLQSGSLNTVNLENLLRKNALNLSDFEAILDFGCGCGRVIRHLKTNGKLYGCDYNSEAIDWAKENLKFAEFSVNQLEPPTTYSNGEFDLIIAISVLTHMTEQICHKWMGEFRRLLRPHGFLVLSLHGQGSLQDLTNEERRRFLAGQIVVREERHVGSNRCATFHPNKYVIEELVKGFRVVDFVPKGLHNFQDLYLLQNLK